MKCSVLMSVYEHDNPKFLKLALESIYNNQTKKPDEIVVVFDGVLTGDLYEILNEFKTGKEEIVFYYPQETNRGLGEALRIGTSKCTGDYIFRMDSDDISDPHRFEKQTAFIEAHSEIDVLGTDIVEFNTTIFDAKKRKRVCPNKHVDIVKMAKQRNPMNHCTVCIKRTALLQSGGYETLMLFEDYFLWLKMIVSGHRLANISESLVYVRLGNDFNTRRGAKLRVSGCRRLQEYMVEHKIISRIGAIINLTIMYIFTHCPNFIRQLVYDRLLRTQL